MRKNCTFLVSSDKIEGTKRFKMILRREEHKIYKIKNAHDDRCTHEKQQVKESSQNVVVDV